MHRTRTLGSTTYLLHFCRLSRSGAASCVVSDLGPKQYVRRQTAQQLLQLMSGGSIQDASRVGAAACSYARLHDDVPAVIELHLSGKALACFYAHDPLSISPFTVEAACAQCAPAWTRVCQEFAQYKAILGSRH